MKAIAYLRVSTHEQATEGVSLDSQLERIEAYAKVHKLELVDIVREEGVSGSKPLADRPGGKILAEAVHGKAVEHVVALKLDRLFRDAIDALQQSRDWDKRGISLHLIDMGGQSLSTGSAMGRMFLTMTAAFAELERNLIAERTSDALRHRKARRTAYGPTPFGFDREEDDLRVNKMEMRVVRNVQKWRESGHSLRKIADRLNDAHVPTKNGKRWHASTVRHILGNDLYA